MHHMKQQAAQVYFPLPMYFQIKVIAKNENKAMAEWIRDTVTKAVEKKRKNKRKLNDLHSFSWKSDDIKLSEHLDDIIYGDS